MSINVILLSEVDLDSPVGTILMGKIKENFDILDALILPTPFMLFGFPGTISMSAGDDQQLGALDLDAPPSGKKWRIQAKIYAQGTNDVRLYLWDKAFNRTGTFDQKTLTGSRADYTLTIDIATAFQGSVGIWAQGGTVVSDVMTCRVDLVDV